MNQAVSETWQARVVRAIAVTGWSRPRMATALNCSERTIWYWERGDCEPTWQSHARTLLEDLEQRHNIRERFKEQLSAGADRRQD